MSRALVVLAILAAGNAGCSERPLTQLVVVADTNLAIPGQVGSVEIEITPPDLAPVRRAGELIDVSSLPVSLGVVHRGGALGPVMVVARALLDTDVVVERRAEVFFVEGRTLVLEVALEAACVGIPCLDDETCEHGVCRSVVVTRDELREWDGTVPRLGDAGTTCFPERCNGIDDDCDGEIDDDVDVSDDPDHCGACGNACPPRMHARPACAGGLCTVSCETGYGDCNADPRDGCEEPLNTLSMCMECGAACEIDNGAPSCFTGMCAVQSCAPGWGDCNDMPADGCESPLDDAAHCGSCAPCAPANAIAACLAGVCGVGACSSGHGDCNGMASDGCETALGTTSACARCGDACGTLAHATTVCAAGTCDVGACEAGWGDCDGARANGCETMLTTMSDCGACGGACALDHATETCAGTGGCRITACEDGWGDCNGTASDGCERSLETGTDCGTCGSACSGLTPLCGRGTGGARACVGACSGSMTMCGTGCVDVGSSLEHCGGCDSMCAPAHAVGECRGGSCGVASCDPGWGDCNGSDADGCETSLDSMANCGACRVACDLPGASETCDAGRCVLEACEAGRGDCDGASGNGCETDVRTLTSCGACGATCALPDATESCETGTCEIVACDAGRADCDGLAADGCEAVLGTLSNCRACNDVCDLPRATEACAADACTLVACDAGFDDCNSMASDGCERSLTTVADCGGCDVACGPFPNATASCTTGACVMDCLPGWGDCNGMRADGCEEPLTTAMHCGGCGMACDGATPVCGPSGTGVACQGTCAPGTTACGLSCADTTSDVLHCGACETPCDPPDATGACVASTCRIESCDGGQADCNGTVADGCERSITTTTDCGACGEACGTFANATAACTAGACVPVCATGFGDCDGSPTNGCERALTSISSCGTCGTVCTGTAGATVGCVAMACAVTACTSNRGDCNGLYVDGCEVNTSNDEDHCGTCGMACPAGQSCRMGSCRP